MKIADRGGSRADQRAGPSFCGPETADFFLVCGVSWTNTGFGENFGSEMPGCPGCRRMLIVVGAYPGWVNVTVNGSLAEISKAHGVSQPEPREVATCAPCGSESRSIAPLNETEAERGEIDFAARLTISRRDRHLRRVHR
jgi:hypothetical protein